MPLAEEEADTEEADEEGAPPADAEDDIELESPDVALEDCAVDDEAPPVPLVLPLPNRESPAVPQPTRHRRKHTIADEIFT